VYDRRIELFDFFFSDSLEHFVVYFRIVAHFILFLHYFQEGFALNIVDFLLFIFDVISNIPETSVVLYHDFGAIENFF
jgi:hypothetical protein